MIRRLFFCLCFLALALLTKPPSAHAQTFPAPPVPPGTEPGESYHLVFVSGNTYSISGAVQYPPPSGSINSLAGADWQVTFGAFVNGLLTQQQKDAWFATGATDIIWTAILSDSTIDANSRVTISAPVYNTQLEKVADDAADFWDGSLDAAIRYDERGDAVSSDRVWSGSSTVGDSSGSDCGDWSDSSTVGEFGDANSNGGTWLGETVMSCANTAHIYGISPVLTLPDLADFDDDDAVTGLDFLTLQQGLGTVGALATHANGDTNGDDFINAADLGVWQSQYGTLAPPQTFLDQSEFLAAVEGEVLASFESVPATNTRDETIIQGGPFQLRSTLDMGVWDQPPADFEGTHPTDGTNCVDTPEGDSVTLVMNSYNLAQAVGLSITDFGDAAGTYNLVAEVHFLYGDVNTYTLATSGLADGNELFAGIVATHQPITSIKLTYGGDSIGIDEVYVVLSPAALASASIPEPTTCGLMLIATLSLLAGRQRR